MHHGGLRGGDDIHLGFVNVDAMDEERFLAGGAHLIQPLDGGHSVLLQRVFPVGGVLSNVDVAADARVPGNAHAFLERLIREGEGGMQAHHGRDLPIALADLLDEARFSSTPPPGTLRSETS